VTTWKSVASTPETDSLKVTGLPRVTLFAFVNSADGRGKKRLDCKLSICHRLLCGLKT